MIKLNIVAVGKLKENYWREAIAEYAKRISRFAAFEVKEAPEGVDSASAESLKQAEAEGILKRLKGCVVLLDLGGEPVTSEGLASFINAKATDGISEFSFVIGGSRGVAEAVKARADKVVNFGKITYPHQLMRVILAEQLYRAMTINNNISYHK